MTTLISQSEVDSFLSCQMKHYYAFGLPVSSVRDGEAVVSHGIAPTEHSESLTRGIIGHEALDTFYSLAYTEGFDAARNAAIGAILNYETNLVEVKTQLVKLIGAYCDHYRSDLLEWEPLAIEKEFRLPIEGTDMEFPFKPDIVMRNKITGAIEVWDHKFLYNYYQERLFPMMPQLKKYCLSLRKLGLRVDGYRYNQISTRANSKDPFRRTTMFKVGASADIFLEEQVDAMVRIKNLKALPNGEWKNTSLHNASSFSCSHCPYLDPCSMELDGDTGVNLHIRSFYGPNKYGYGKEED